MDRQRTAMDRLLCLAELREVDGPGSPSITRQEGIFKQRAYSVLHRLPLPRYLGRHPSRLSVWLEDRVENTRRMHALIHLRGQQRNPPHGNLVASRELSGERAEKMVRRV